MPDEASRSDLSIHGSTIGGDVVGRDQIVNNIQTIYQRALTAADEAARDRALEPQTLARGVSAFAHQLQARVTDAADSTSGNPYKGLLSYRLSDSPLFFGRELAIRDLLDPIATGPLSVLHAESGAGKTSLRQAGLSPRLIAGGHLPLYVRPYNADPALVVKRAFISDPSQAPILATAPLRDFLRQVGGVLGPVITLCIYLDQFEEFFSHLDQPVRAEFVGKLAECLADQSLNVRSVRSLAFSPGGQTSASGSDDGAIRLWDVGDPQSHALTPLADPPHQTRPRDSERGLQPRRPDVGLRQLRRRRRPVGCEPCRLASPRLPAGGPQPHPRRVGPIFRRRTLSQDV